MRAGSTKYILKIAPVKGEHLPYVSILEQDAETLPAPSMPSVAENL